MRLSIIVPVYNVEQHLEKCIISILDQELSDFELILVNDGSTDSSPKIINDYSKKDLRIKVINKKNAGVSSARNAGLDVAKGEFIGFVDSDDLIHPSMYRFLINIAESEKADIVQCGFEKCNEIIDLDLIIEKQDKIHKFDNKMALKLIKENKHFNFVVWNKIYRRELVKDVRFEKGKLNEDVIYIFKCLHYVKTICVKNTPLYSYFQNESGIMSNMNSNLEKKILNHLIAFDCVTAFYKNKCNLGYKVAIYLLSTWLVSGIKYFLLSKNKDGELKKTLEALINKYSYQFSDIGLKNTMIINTFKVVRGL